MSLTLLKALDRVLGAAAIGALRPVRAALDLLGGEGDRLAIRTIAVVKFWGVGNTALLLPLVRALRERYPAAHLSAVTMAENAPLLRPAVDRLLPVRSRSPMTALLDLFRAAAALRRRRVDLAIDFEQYVRTSQLLLFLAGARQIVAFDTPGLGRAALADVRVPYRDDRHASESFLDLARAAGARERLFRPGGLSIGAREAEAAEAWCRARSVPPRPLVILHPGSGDNFPGRRWPTRRFGLVARRLHDAAGAAVAVTGTAAESGLAREVVEASERPIHDLSGRLALADLAALLARASLLLSNDTGPVHIASALGVPVLGLYGPNTPRLYGPLSPGSVAFYDPPPCSPCITNFNYKTSRCRNPVCIDAIPVEAVAEAALARLAARRAEESA